jgi:plasmid segregation protein ParM
MESYLWTGKTDLPEKYREMMEKVAKDYAERIIGRLREYEYNPDIMKLHVMGGGICILKNFWNFGDANVNFIEDIRATAKGYEALALNDLRRGKDAGRSRIPA